MIVRPTERAVHLITQPDHAALARRIMQHWRALDGHPRRDSVMLAIGEHDNGWREPDREPTVDPASGRVHDFVSAPAEVRQGVWPRAVERLADDPWAAALVAQHAVTVYDRFRQDRAWDGFFMQMEAARDRLVAATPLSAQDLAGDYPFVRIGDLISLVFCNKWTQESYHDWTFRFDADRVVVSPDPFAGGEVPIEVRAVELPDRPYASDVELHQTMRGAPVITLTGRCVGG